MSDHHNSTSRQGEGSRRHRDTRSRSPDHNQRRQPRDSDDRRRQERGHRAEKDSSSRRHRSPHRHHRERDSPAVAAAPVELPFGARQLTKSDLRRFEPLLAHYLDLQKQRYIEDMDDREVKGRWKSFMGKWNRGELAEGWYDPDMYERIMASQPEAQAERESHREAERPERRNSPEEQAQPERATANRDEDEDSDYGPALPSSSSRGDGRRVGVGIPSKDDLALRDEMRIEDRESAREDLRAERRADRRLQKERLEELAPRAEPGSRERRLEKKREAGDKMRQFREGSPGGAAVNDGELMGGGDSLAELRREKEQAQRRKTEREVRREELARARQEEIEEKRRKWQEREQGTMSMLQELARQRFGSGS